MKTIFVVGISDANQKIMQLIFSNCFDGLKTTVRMKACKEENQHNFFIVNKRLTEAKVKFE